MILNLDEKAKEKRSTAQHGWHGKFKMLFILSKSDRKYNAMQGCRAQMGRVLWAYKVVVYDPHSCISLRTKLSLSLCSLIQVLLSLTLQVRQLYPPVVFSDSWVNTSTCLCLKIHWDVSCIKRIHLKKGPLFGISNFSHRGGGWGGRQQTPKSH